MGINYYILVEELVVVKILYNKFKKAFNKNGDIGFSISKDCYDINKYSYLIELRKKIDPSFDVSTSFFPAYRSK